MKVTAVPLTAAALEPYGQVLEATEAGEHRHQFAANVVNDRPAAKLNTTFMKAVVRPGAGARQGARAASLLQPDVRADERHPPPGRRLPLGRRRRPRPAPADGFRCRGRTGHQLQPDGLARAPTGAWRTRGIHHAALGRWLGRRHRDAPLAAPIEIVGIA